MSRVVQINITESPLELKQLLKSQKTVDGKERVQVLYLLKTNQVKTVQQLAGLIGRNRATVQRWLSQYRTGGLKKMLAVGKSTGRTSLIPESAVERLKKELSQPQGFESYEEVRRWLAAELGIQVKYDVVHNLVHHKLKASLKVARSKSNEQEPGAVENFKKELPQKLSVLLEEAQQHSKKFKKVRFWCETEDRLGLKTIPRRLLTAQGIKPVGFLLRREKYYMYGLVEPKTGDSFFREISHLDHECFQEFLNDFSRVHPRELHIIQLDNGSFHTTGKLLVPENIILRFQPAHCPELNPIDRLWEYLKGFLSWNLFENLDALKAKVREILNSFSKKTIKSLTGWKYILKSLKVARI